MITSPNRPVADRLLPWAELTGFAAAASVAFYLELSRHPDYLERPQLIFAYTANPETTCVALAILAAPLIWWLGGRRAGERESGGAGEKDFVDQRASSLPCTPASLLHRLLMSAFLFLLSIASTWVVGQWFRGMPPAYHDEYSYLFQAKTFLAGQLYFPQHPCPDFFDQMHVLNDNGVFASRYFPGVGLWLAPWVAVGQPYWGQYLAGGFIVVLVFCIGQELATSLVSTAGESALPFARRGGLAIGVLAALFCVISPAMLLFGNLLLSHHPTMLGLAAFALCYMRALRSESLVWPICGGVALCLAMLCRPLTAFGFASPFGLHLAWLVLRGELPRCTPRLLSALVPLIAGVGLLAGYNAALTGNPLQSPYGLYTQIYTPNHCYGFHNVTRGEQQAGPKVLANYNRWAEDLTVPRAVELLAGRISASSLWSVGRVSLAWVAGVCLVVLWRFPVQWKLLAGAVAGLHAVYLPYGFEGVFGLSYVFESVPVLCLLAAGMCVWFARSWQERGRWGRIGWVTAFMMLGMSGPLDRLGEAVSEVRFPRRYYTDFERKLSLAGVRPPALVFIEPDPSDRHRDLVVNSPTLDDPILRVRNTGSRKMELVRMYSDRQLWFYDARTDSLARLLTDTETPRTNENR